MTDNDFTEFEGMGSQGAHAQQDRRNAAAETDRWRTGITRSFDPERLGESRRPKLGPEARVTSSFGAGKSVGGWERLAQRARDALQRDGRSGDGNVHAVHHDPDTKEAEDRRLGPSTSVARYPHN